MARWLLALLPALFVLSARASADAPVDVAAGERLYRAGLLSAGEPVRADREPGGESRGALVACVNCHRRSGLGSAEGNTAVPAITARFLYAQAGVQAARPTLSAAAADERMREPYDDARLAAAIRTGIGRGGRELRPLMPRYQLNDADMANLIAYLKSLPVDSSPGVDGTTIHLATIVTPDAESAARDGVLAVLRQFVADKNAFQRGGARPMRSGERIGYRVTRRWQLHEWRLEGPPAGWDAQLRAHLRAEPVFAVLSGAGGADWQPVHQFCERSGLPCLFPNVSAPPDAESDYYSMYLSRGVGLDAALIDTQLSPSGRLVEVYAPGGEAEAGARLLASRHGARPVSLRPLAAPDSAPATALADVHAEDSLVLWLAPGDLARLPPRPPSARAVYVSGTLGDFEEAPLPAAWRAVSRMAYPADLPEGRAVRLANTWRWLQIQHIARVSGKSQADTYLACGILAEALNDMLDDFMRDFLIERVESLLSHRQLTGYYPRLGLAPGQRFASKGGYLVQFDASAGSQVHAVTEWLVP